MGSIFSTSMVSKINDAVENESLVCAFGTSQGLRDTYTGSFTCMLDFDTDASLFGIFDGQGGPEIARYAAHRMPQFIKAKYLETGAYETALKYAFNEFDRCLLQLDSQVQSLGTQVLEDIYEQEKPYGKESFKELLLALSTKSTSAIIVVLTKTRIFIGNLGGSRCVISEGESANILAVGNSRVLGACKNKRNLTKKEQEDAARPAIWIMTVKPDIHDFMVIACDGVWSSINSQAAVTFIQEQMKLPDTSLTIICKNFISKCMAQSHFSLFGKDNMTFLVVQFKAKTKSLPIEIVDNRDREERERRPSKRDLLLRK